MLFQREPDEPTKDAIAAAVPAPLCDSIGWTGIHLMAASDQFAHVLIAETYGSPEDPEDEDEGFDEEDDDEEGGWFFASSAAVSRFNGDIERWLHEAHRLCPILVAYRHEDGESGGTELSPWHRWSAHQTDRLLPVLEPILERGIDDAVSHAARGILEMVRDSGVFLPKRVQALLDPGWQIRAALDAGDSAALASQLAAKEHAMPLLEEELSIRLPKHLRALLGATPALAERDDLSDEVTVVLARALIANRTDPSVEQASQLVRARAGVSKLVADQLAYHAYQAIQGQEWAEAIGLFDLVIDSPELDRTAYNNALYAIMTDNNQMPVDRALTDRFLAAALPYGEENPSIFYNAACVYVELGEVERTLECLALARKHGYQDPAKMRDEPLFRAIAGDPRFIAIFSDL